MLPSKSSSISHQVCCSRCCGSQLQFLSCLLQVIRLLLPLAFSKIKTAVPSRPLLLLLLLLVMLMTLDLLVQER